MSFLTILCIFFYISSALVFPMPQATSAKASYFRKAEVHESGGSIQIAANSPRPLAQVADALRQKYGWTIDYEDPRFTSPSDLVVVEGPPRQTLPAGGDFKIEFPGNNPQEEKVLTTAVNSYNLSGHAGRFELRKGEGDRFALVGIKALDASGKLAAQPVLLDAPIAISNEHRTASAMLSLLCQKLSENQHLAVVLGVTPRRILDRTDVSVGGAETAARKLLSQTLAATQRRLYWELVFDPDAKRYMLDVFALPT
jgi:hypothetical protein